MNSLLYPLIQYLHTECYNLEHNFIQSYFSCRQLNSLLQKNNSNYKHKKIKKELKKMRTAINFYSAGFNTYKSITIIKNFKNPKKILYFAIKRYKTLIALNKITLNYELKFVYYSYLIVNNLTINSNDFKHPTKEILFKKYVYKGGIYRCLLRSAYNLCYKLINQIPQILSAKHNILEFQANTLNPAFNPAFNFNGKESKDWITRRITLTLILTYKKYFKLCDLCNFTKN